MLSRRVTSGHKRSKSDRQRRNKPGSPRLRTTRYDNFSPAAAIRPERGEKEAPNGAGRRDRHRERLPNDEDRKKIDAIIFSELAYGRFESVSRRFFQRVIRRLQKAGCDAVALSCTEIPLLISEADSPLPVLDSTRTLARAALREALAT
jgi:hypothetical protein